MKERPSNNPGGGSKGNTTPSVEEHSDKKGRDPTPNKRRSTPTPEHDSSDTKRRKVDGDHKVGPANPTLPD